MVSMHTKINDDNYNIVSDSESDEEAKKTILRDKWVTETMLNPNIVPAMKNL